MTASRGTRIEVTAEDIRIGVPGDPEKCALCVALRRHGFTVRSVGGVGTKRGPAAILVDHDGLRRKVYLPEACKVFARAFDARKPVDPITFELEATP